MADTEPDTPPRSTWLDPASTRLADVVQAINDLADVVQGLRLGDRDVIVELKRRIDIARHNTDSIVGAHSLLHGQLAQLVQRVTVLEDNKPDRVPAKSDPGFGPPVFGNILDRTDRTIIVQLDVPTALAGLPSNARVSVRAVGV